MAGNKKKGIVSQVQLEESHALLADACNQKEEKDSRIDELEEQLEALQQDRDQLAKEVLSLKG
jgi:molecular chaperone GrpE (heat shock protein)